MNQDNATRAAGSSALDCWPTFSEYGGGGTILTRTTGQSGFDDECRRHRVDAAQVRKLIADGNEVLILSGEIKAVQRDGWANAPREGRAVARTLHADVGSSDSGNMP